MADVKASALIEWLKDHLGDGYVYGTVGQTCTISLLQVKERQYGKSMGNGYYQLNGDYRKGKCARWLGKWVADCSGLIKAGRKAISGVYRDVSAQGTYDQCSRKGKINTMPITPGCAVFIWSTTRRRMGHVGIYIGNGKVIESRGVSYGVVQTEFSRRKWGYWGLLDWLELNLPTESGSYVPNPDADGDDGDSADPLPDDRPCDGVPSLEALGDTGYSVKLLQQWLNLHGTTPRLAEDGIFGPKTEDAVTRFKLDRGFNGDGVACVDVWSALIVPPPAVPLTLEPLRAGNSGILVTLLQRLLYTAGITPWGIDGQFGSVTEQAVQVYQKAKGLPVDGVVGPATWAALVGNQPATPVTVRRGDSGAEVKQLQQLLISKGYEPGAVDGIFGPKTESAVKAFQTAAGLAVDGIAGPKTWAALQASNPQPPPPPIPRTIRRGDTGPEVRLAQTQLNRHGSSLTVDGVFGAKTEEATRAFQQENQLQVDGIIGPKTWAALL